MIRNKDMFRFLFGTEAEDVSENIILTAFLPVEKFIDGSFEKKAFKGKLYSGISACSGSKKYTVIRTPIGSVPAGDCVLLLGMTAAKRVIYAGSCGGLRGADIGDIFIAKKAFSGGGFSEHYSPYGGIDGILDTGKFFTADTSLEEEIRIYGGSVRAKSGVIFTIGSLASEIPRTLEKIERRGFDGIDMELAAVYHAAGMSGMRSAGILFVSDLPLKKPFWQTPDKSGKEKLKEAVENVVKLSLLSAGG